MTIVSVSLDFDYYFIEAVTSKSLFGLYVRVTILLIVMEGISD